MKIIYTGEKTSTDHGYPILYGHIILDDSSFPDGDGPKTEGDVEEFLHGLSGDRWLNEALQNSEYDILF